MCVKIWLYSFCYNLWNNIGILFTSVMYVLTVVWASGVDNIGGISSWMLIFWWMSGLIDRLRLAGTMVGKALLKLPYLFAAWLFWTFHTKSHNMKALIIISHSWSPFLPSEYPCKSHDHDHEWTVLFMAWLL